MPRGRSKARHRDQRALSSLRGTLRRPRNEGARATEIQTGGLEALQMDYFAQGRVWSALVRQRAVRRKHDIEREMLKIEALPVNDGRKSLLKRLRADLEDVSLRCL